MALQAGSEVLQRTQSWAGKGEEIQNPSMFWLAISLLSPLCHTGLWAFLWARYKAFTAIVSIILFAVDCKILAPPLHFGTPSQCTLTKWAGRENLGKSRPIPCPVPLQSSEVAANKAKVSLKPFWTFRIKVYEQVGKHLISVHFLYCWKM